MKKAILILLVFFSLDSFAQGGVIRKTQIELTDTLTTHIVKANWDAYISGLVTGTIDLTNYFNKVSDTSDDITEGVTHLFDQTVSFSGGTNVTIGGTYPSFTITDNTLSQTQISAIVGDTANILRAEWLVSIHDSILASETQLRSDISDSIAAIDMLTQTVSNGDKTASFTHDASSASIGNYNLSTTSAVTVSIHNLSSGNQGTIFLDVGASNPSSITITGYSDAGSTEITNKIELSTLANAANKMTSVTYTCANDGTNLEIILIYGQEP